MSLGLVAYDDSEESENEVEDSEENVSSSNNTVTQPPLSEPTSASGIGVALNGGLNSGSNSPIHISDDEVEILKDSESANIKLPESKICFLNTDIDVKCLTSSNKKSGPVKITIPSLNDVEEDDEPPSKKKIKPSQKGSGLFALLPNPKSSLVPQSVVNKNRNVTNKQSTTAAPKVTKPFPKAKVTNKPPLISYEDSGDEDESSGSTDFFSLESKEIDVPHAPVDIDLTLSEVSQSEASQPAAQNGPHSDSRSDTLTFSSSLPASWQTNSSSTSSSSGVSQSSDQYTTSEFMSFNNQDLKLNDEAMQQLCGRRDRLKGQDFSIIDVSGDAIMPDSREWLTKQLTEETAHRPSHKKKDGPTTQQKRKHQITYLAFQAKENELELKNQWSNNRMSRKQTQAKYGF